MATTVQASLDRRALASIIGCTSVFGLCAGMASPLIGLNLAAMGADNTLIGLNTAMLALSMLVFSPFVPRLTKRLGFRTVILCSLALEAAMFLCFTLTRNIAMWFVFRLVMGAALVGLFVTAETWINQIATDATRGRVMGLYATVFALSIGCGPLLIAAIGIEGALPFVVAAGFVFLSSLPLLLAGDVSPNLEEHESFGVVGFVRQAPTLCLAVFVFAFIEIGTGGLLPVHGVRQGMDHATAATLLTALAAGSVALQFPLGWLADHLNRNTILIVCALGAAICAASLPLAMGTLYLLWPLLFVWGGLFAGIYTLALAIVGERYRGGELVTANAAFGVLWGAGSLTGPTLTGMAMDIWTQYGLPAVFAIACALLAGVAVYRRFTAR